MKKGILSIIIFFCLGNLFGQVIYLSSTNNRLYKLNIVSCNYTEIVRLSRSLTDITFHPDKTLYGINTNGNLFEIDTTNGATTDIFQFNGGGQNFNSLTTSADGIIYTTGDEGKLYSYDKANNMATYHGIIGYRATGDLTFYKGKLYAAAFDDKIILVDIINPSNSSIAIDENIGGEIFGIVSYASSCDSINCYAISSGNSVIYEIDFASQSLQQVCQLNIRIGGGASTYEFYGSAPIIFNQVTTSDPSCSNNDGTFSIIVTGGIAPLTYSINGIDFQSSNTFNNLSSGTYQFIVSDANGCTIIEEVSLADPSTQSPVIQNLSVTPTTCGGSNGEIVVTANGGNGAIVYSIDGLNFQGSPVFNNLGLGQYFISVKDAAGCKSTDSIEITSLSLDTIKKITASLVSCDVSNGTLVVDMQNGAGIQYSLDGIHFQSQNHFDLLSPGTYVVTIKDSNGCLDSMTAVISPPVAIRIDNFVSTDPLCAYDEGSVLINASGGTGQILYSIDGIHFQPLNTFEHLAPSAYDIFIKDENGCMDTIQTIINPGVSLLIGNIDTDSSHCELNDGAMLITSIGGTGQVQYSIDDMNYQNENRFNNLAPSNYHITVQDVNGCIDTANTSIDAIFALVIENIESTLPRCDVNDGTLEITTLGEIGQVEYSIDGLNYQLTGNFTNLGPGHYIIEIHDDAGCKSEATADINAPTPIQIDKIESQPSACEETTGSIVIHASGGTGLISYSFDGGSFQSGNTFNNLAGGMHELVVADENGCQMDTLIRVAKQRCKIYIPNSFSPNLDGVNDLFQIATSNDQNIQITKYLIFDRWGNKVYSTGNFPITSTELWWDGTFKKMNVSTGVFAYYIEVEYEDGGTEIFKGDVTLVR